MANNRYSKQKRPKYNTVSGKKKAGKKKRGY